VIPQAPWEQARARATLLVVMPGLDPGIHHLQENALFWMDCRVKPGNDEPETAMDSAYAT
jgi:hypothetical protein